MQTAQPSCRAVSYTHLDVYKRQPVPYPLRMGGSNQIRFYFLLKQGVGFGRAGTNPAYPRRRRILRIGKLHRVLWKDVYKRQHVVDELFYNMLDHVSEDLAEECPEEIVRAFSDRWSEEEIRSTYAEMVSLKKEGQLFSADDYAQFADMMVSSPIKALCLNIAHDCKDVYKRQVHGSDAGDSKERACVGEREHHRSCGIHSWDG